MSKIYWHFTNENVVVVDDDEELVKLYRIIYWTNKLEKKCVKLKKKKFFSNSIQYIDIHTHASFIENFSENSCFFFFAADVVSRKKRNVQNLHSFRSIYFDTNNIEVDIII